MSMKFKDTIDGSIAKNSATATKLESARTLTIGSKGKTFDGSDNVSWTLDEIGAAASSHNHDSRYYTESEINTKVSALQSEIDADVKVEADRAKAAENTLQANIDKKANSSHGNHVPTTQTANNAKFLRNDNTWQTVTPGNIGAYTKTEIDSKVTTINNTISGKANKSHGNHVPATETANNAKFLRNDNTWQTVTPDNIGAATSSHGTHVTYSKTTPKAAGTAAVGSEGTVARGDHVHPLQTSVSGNAGTATKLATPVTLTIGDKGKTFDGSGNQSWSLSEMGAYSNKGGTIGGTINYQFSGTGGHAIGLDWTNNDTKKTKFGGIGGLANAGVGSILYMGWGSEPWSSANNFCVSSSAIKYKNNKIYHAGDKPTLSELGAAAESHGTHVTYASSAPKANGTAAVGSSGKVAREDHVHPLQTTVSGNAGSATKLASAREIKIGNKTNSFNGTANISFTLAEIGAAAASHSHTLLESVDSRSVNGAPNSYTARGITPEFKSTSTIGLPDSGKSFAGVITYQQWSDVSAWSGGKTTQFATLDDGRMYYRKGEGTTWGSWGQFYTTTHKPTYSDVGAAKASHGTHVGDAYATAAPKSNGTAAVGTSSRIAREDHVHPLQTSVSGNAGTATKLAAAKTLTIGNSGKTFDGSGNVKWTLAEIGASPLQKSVVSKSVSNGKLTLTTDRYQKATLASGNTIVLPSVSNFTEINLFVKGALTNINLPDNCKWRVDHNLSAGTSYMFTFIYTTVEWLAEVKIYS